jgi:hypothetical protein
MCPLPVLRRPYEDMEWSLVEKAEREIHGNGLKLKWLHEMGEPLLYARIDDAIRLFPEASLSTNGLVLTPEIGAKLLGSPLRRIRICVDSVNPHVYPQIRTGGVRQFVAPPQVPCRPTASIRVEIQKMRSAPHAGGVETSAAFDLRSPNARVMSALSTSTRDGLTEGYGCGRRLHPDTR